LWGFGQSGAPWRKIGIFIGPPGNSTLIWNQVETVFTQHDLYLVEMYALAFEYFWCGPGRQSERHIRFFHNSDDRRQRGRRTVNERDSIERYRVSMPSYDKVMFCRSGQTVWLVNAPI
jgi:hypothetical protein